MKRFLVMPEKARFTEIDAETHRIAYCLCAAWYNPKTRVAVMDTETGQTKIFTRSIDASGNIVGIIEH